MNDQLLTIQVVPVRPEHVLFRLVGELDLSSHEQLGTLADSELAGGCRHLVVDATALAFCDASGLGALVRARLQFAAAGGTLQLSNSGCVIERLLSITGLTGLTRPDEDPGQ